eukprot:279642-Pelagomonas_calceolata.AAC.4
MYFKHEATAQQQPQNTSQPKKKRRGTSKAQVSDDSEDLDLGFLKVWQEPSFHYLQAKVAIALCNKAPDVHLETAVHGHESSSLSKVVGNN